MSPPGPKQYPFIMPEHNSRFPIQLSYPIISGTGISYPERGGSDITYSGQGGLDIRFPEQGRKDISYPGQGGSDMVVFGSPTANLPRGLK